MNESGELKQLAKNLKEKLKYARQLLAEYEEKMDYASHCNLAGFAEGIEFTLEEIRSLEKKTGARPRRQKSKGKDKKSAR